MLFGIAAIRLAPSVNQIVSGISILRSSVNGMNILYENIFEINELNQIRGSVLYTSKSPIKNSIESEEEIDFETLKLNNVSFSYKNSSRITIENINLEINNGDIVGIIGPSGSGKTTLIDIILGLLNNSSGTIKFNDMDLEKNLKSWQSQIAYLPQEIFTLDKSLKQNITLTLDDCDIDKVKFDHSIKMSKLEGLIDELPEGINTIIGEKGIRISGGQRQRIALARAFYFERNILIFDEATSALDTETEKEIMNEINQLKGVKTIILIAHRLSTLNICNKIYKLEKGRIVSSGTFQEIITNKKLIN